MSAYVPDNDLYDGVLRRKIDHSRVMCRVTRTDTHGETVVEVWERDHPPHYLNLHTSIASTLDVLFSIIMHAGVQPLPSDRLLEVDVNRLTAFAVHCASELYTKAVHPSSNGAEWSAAELAWWYDS